MIWNMYFVGMKKESKRFYNKYVENLKKTLKSLRDKTKIENKDLY